MNRNLFVVALVSLATAPVLFPFGCTQPPVEGAEEVIHEFNPDEWNLVWSDEFDVDGPPNPDNWTYEDKRPGWVNDERQNYVPDRLENARVENGNLIIEARADNYDGYRYSSGRLYSQGKADFLYGRFEVRARLPRGRGTWPAIWMMPTDSFQYATTCTEETGWGEGCDAWPNGGEIDIMEHVGHDPGVIHSSFHMYLYSHLDGNQPTLSIEVDDVFDTYHVYAVEKFADRMSCYVDNRHVITYENPGEGWQSWPFNQPFHFILNIAIGGIWGGRDGIDPEAFPMQMIVDYVRAYELKEPVEAQ